MNIVQIENLSHFFSKENQVLHSLNLSIPESSIYGFLGPNGAGKTTTLRILLGLLKHSHGTVTVFGKDMKQHRIENLNDIGSLIEAPSLYLHLTATENLEVYRLLFNLPKTRIQEVLELVDLAKTGKKKAKSFSLGMKQRLSIAIALLHKPKLLVLDEPTNGLDPIGIKEMRNLLQKLNKEQGTSIIISSHMLAEIERFATHIGIIHHGQKIFEGTLEELQEFKGKSQFALRAINHSSLILALQELNVLFDQKENEVVVSVGEEIDRAKLLKSLISKNVEIHYAQLVQNDLEDIFLNMTK